MLLFQLVALLTQFGGGPTTPRFEAELLAGRSALQPGISTPIVVRITVADGWHVYDPVLIGPGLPTTITVEAEGTEVAVGEWRFPPPTLEESAGIEYLGHEETFLVLGSVTVPKSAAARGSVTLSATISGLACKEACVPVEATAALELPIADDAQAANADVVENATENAVARLADAEHIVGSRLAVSHTRVPVGGTGTFAAVIQVEEGKHIQDRDPGNDDLVATQLWISAPDGVELGTQQWPRAHVREMEYVGKVREQSGEVVIHVPFSVVEDADPGSATFRVLVEYQSCTDDGTCFSPMMAAGTAAFEIVPANQSAVAAGTFPAMAESSGTGASGGGKAPEGLVGWLLLFLALFAGGIILNVMPCVLPVISLKILGFVNQAGEHPARVFQLGLVYSLGVMLSFVPIAVAVAFFGGAWGGMMQSPAFVIAMCAVLLAFGLSMLGVFEIHAPGAAMNTAAEASTKEGFGGALLNGVFATLLATPCLAPLLGGAIGALLAVPAWVGFIGIMTVGAGLAFPYLLLTAFPKWLKAMPKPGPWMVTFKQSVGFVMLLVVAWLLTFLKDIVEQASAFSATLIFLVVVGWVCWLVGRIKLSASTARFYSTWATGIVVLIVGWYGSHWLYAKPSHAAEWHSWKEYDPVALSEEGYTVYIDYTAKWCITCNANKAIALNRADVVRTFDELGVVAIKADFTKRDAAIQEELNANGRSGVPLNIVYPAGRPEDKIILPETLTQSIVLEAVKKAGKSTADPSDLVSHRRKQVRGIASR